MLCDCFPLAIYFTFFILWLSNIPLYICATSSFPFICQWTFRLLRLEKKLILMSWMRLWQHEGLNLGPAFNFKCCHQIQTVRCTVNCFSSFFPGSTESHQKTNSWWQRKTGHSLNSFGNEGERIVSLDISFCNTKTSKLLLNKRFLFT